MKRLLDISPMLLALIIVFLAFNQFLAVADEARHAAYANVDERNIEAWLKDSSIDVAIPINWKKGIFEWAKMDVQVVDLYGKRIAGKSGNVYGFRKRQTYRDSIAGVPDLTNLSLYSLQYTLTLPDRSRVEGRRGLAECVGTLETHLIGSNEFLAGSTPTMRLVALNHATGRPIGDAPVSFAISDGKKKVVLFRGYTDDMGTIDATFRIPDDLTGEQTLLVQVHSSLGDDVIENSITIKKSHKILLTTDKPLYQPGQTIHIRSLSLSAATLKAAGDEDVIIEVQDAKGNKVFKRVTTTDKFGIAAADFVLADEVNAGLYKIRVLLGETIVEKGVTVKRYVLPKFKINLTTDNDYYMPGETVRGEVQTDYFFGKPVSNGVVIVKLSKFDVEFAGFARIEGKTDASGHYSFEAKLPDYFVGQPLQQGKAFVKVDVRIVDGADHKEEITRNINIAAEPLVIVAVPESGTFVPGVENIIYIMAAYPDGTPARAQVDVRIKQTGPRTISVRTDALGIASVKILPETDLLDMTIHARDASGARAKKDVTLQAAPGEHHVLLRTDQALYKVGDTIKATILATRRRGNVYVDLIKEGQTVLTRSVEIREGRGELEVALSSDLSGSLQMNAYQITPTSDIIRDSRLLYVNPANDLTIDVTLDRDVYRPGGDATITFSVRDKNGHPVLAALGVSIVDESVFALQEMQPGLEKIYFTLEKELMKPRYEIHGYTMDDIITEGHRVVDPDEVSKRQKAARVLLSSAETFWEPALNINTYNDKEKMYVAEVNRIMQEKTEKIEKALKRFRKRHERFPNPDETLAILVEERLLKQDDATDPWGNWYRVSDVNLLWQDYLTFQLISDGPDEKADTKDDVRFTHQPPTGKRGWFGNAVDMVAEGIMAPMARMKADMSMLEKEEPRANGHSGVGGAADKKQVRIRKYFPETLFFNAAILTDPNGIANMSLQMADSITTWRMASMASTIGGALGSAATPIRVFQDFFVDIDLPVALTQNDRISIPVAVYNYLPGSQKVTLELTKEDWFQLMDEPVKEIVLEKNEVSVVYFTITAKKVGWQNLTVHGLGDKMSDAIKRQILVAPDGKEFLVNHNDRLEGQVAKTITIPRNAVDDASTILVKIYPGTFSQIVEGLDGILRMPSGCFEQTSSATYPNILVLDYIKQTKQVTPEIQMKAEGFINTGYQRLLSFEVNGGGFEWFGNPPANQILTAYGLMEFKDMAKVHEVDPDIIARTQRWLLSKQQSDGSWAPDQSFMHQESWNRIQNSNLPVTAYVAWSLLETDYKGTETDRAITYIKTHMDEANDPYVLALCANALVLADRNDDSALRKLDRMKIEKDGAVHWESKLNTMTYSHGASADIETTALASIAFLRSGRYGDVTNKVMTYLIRSKDSRGTWHSTQATVLAMKAMVIALGSTTEEVDGTITVSIDGENASTLRITPADSDVMRLVDLKKYVHKGDNNVKIGFEGEGSMLYQIVGRYYLPWITRPDGRQELMSIEVNYDKTRLEKDDLLTCSVRVSNNRPATANMVMVDLGVPPGFTVQPERLQELVENKTIEKYTLTGRQIIIYVRKIDANASLNFSYQLKAKFPVKAKTPTSRVYEYYDPSVEDFAEPVLLEIRK